MLKKTLLSVLLIAFALSFASAQQKKLGNET